MAKRRQPNAPRRVTGVADDAEWVTATGWRRWWNLGTKTAVGIGAVASATAAGLSLWPGPDPANVAKINTVQVTANVPLSEYRQRLAAAHLPEPVGARPWGAAAPVSLAGVGSPWSGAVQVRATSAPGGEDQTADPEPDEEPTEPPGEEPTGPPDDGETADPSTPEPTGEAPVAPPSTEESPEAPAAGGSAPIMPAPSNSATASPEVAEGVCQRVPITDSAKPCRQNLDGQPTINAMSTGANGEPLSAGEAVDRIVTTFKQARVTGGQSGEPVGVVVAVDVELMHMRDEAVFVSWSMWQAGGTTRLYGEWLNTNLAYRLQATSDHDSASVDFWIPLPQATGPYFIRSTLIAGGSTIASAESEHFT